MYLSFETSVPKLNWRSNEVCIKLLRIIAKELDTNGTYASQIDNADSTYNMYLSFETSVPKLDWRSNEVCIKLLRIIAKELDK